jgi:hypothetical protein
MEHFRTPARLVYLVDEIREARDDLVEAVAVSRVDLLALQRLSETLGLGVVIRIVALAGRANQGVRGRFPKVRLGCVLCAGIRGLNTSGGRRRTVTAA